MTLGATRIGSGVMAVLFLLAVVVQFNDPDPLPWILVYGAAAWACVLHLRARLPLWFAASVALISGIWGALLLPGVLGEVGFLELFQEIGMDSPEIEVGREAFGLLLVAGWMVVLSISIRSRMRGASPP